MILDVNCSEPTVPVVVRDENGSASVLLSGDIDLVVAGELTTVVGHLVAIPSATVVVDMTRVTFAGSALANFVAQLRDGLPRRSTVTLYGASPATQLVLDIAAVS